MKPKLCPIIFHAPGAAMQFQTTPERAKRIIDFMLEQASEASEEVKTIRESETQTEPS